MDGSSIGEDNDGGARALVVSRAARGDRDAYVQRARARMPRDAFAPRAFDYVLDVWPDYERASVSLSSDVEEDGGAEVAFVERMGPKGSRRVRVSMAGAGWVAVERDFAIGGVP